MDAAAFNTCARPCTDQACTDACAARYPAAGAAFHTVSQCRFDSCGPECVCVANAQDTACTACAKAHCCADYAKYNAASGVADFSACIAPCSTQACLDTCSSAHPEAGAAYRTLSTCLTSSCKTPCNG
jgi:hypothetical protein